MPRNYLSTTKKQLIAARAKYRCEYCQCRSDIALESFEVEHILAIALGGGDEMSNLAFACRGCNSRKATRQWIIDKTSGERIPIYNPRVSEWKTHFEWSDDFLTIIGKTSVGKVTINALQLNRIGVFIAILNDNRKFSKIIHLVKIKNI